jgi:hypothetical protein
MLDITMCYGEGCEKRDECLRYTAKPCKYAQSYFTTTPIKDGKCEHHLAKIRCKAALQGKNEEK